MSKIYNKYENNVDKTWYHSSNIVYSECDDNENELKTVRVTFKDGRTYQYEGVDVNKYLLFREDISQGKALNTIMKQYECKKVEPMNVELLMEEYKMLTAPTEDECNVKLCENKITIIDKNNESHEYEMKDINDLQVLKDILSILNVKYKTVDGCC